MCIKSDFLCIWNSFRRQHAKNVVMFAKILDFQKILNFENGKTML
jgi:hypothetical protein